MYALQHQGVPICQSCYRCKCFSLVNTVKNLSQPQLSLCLNAVSIARSDHSFPCTSLVAASVSSFHIFFSLVLKLQLVELLSIRAPAPDVKLKLLKEIAVEHELEWDPSATESELLKPHEDLLVRIAAKP